MYQPRFNFPEIEQRIASGEQPFRCRAAQDLLAWIKADPAMHEKALPLFRKIIGAAPDGATTRLALQGLDALNLHDEARTARLHLLSHPSAQLVATLILEMTDPTYAHALIIALSNRPEKEIHVAAIRTLGRMRTTPDAVLPALLNALNNKTLRPHATEALGDLGDPRAIPNLEPLLRDRTEAWPVDNHGPMLHIRDLAEESLRQIAQRVNA